MARLLVGAGGCAIAAAVVLSPMTIVAGTALVFITMAVCRGVSGTDRRVLLWILVVAIALRVAAIAALFLWSEWSDPYQVSSFPFDGDGAFVKIRSLWIRNTWLNVPIDPIMFQNAFQEYGWSSYLYLLAYLQYLLGPAPYAVHLLSVCWTIAAAGLLYRLMRRSHGSVAAIVALVLILFLPTLFLWSISAIREAWLLLLMTVVLVSFERAVRGRGWATRAWGVAGVIAGALVLDTTREGSLLIIVVGLLVALGGSLMARRLHALAASVVILLLVGAIALQQPSVEARVIARMRAAATLHIGHVRTEGYHFKLLDQRFYAGTGELLETMTADEARRYALRALPAFILFPVPWQAYSRAQLLFIPQQLLWYALLSLAVVGAVRGCRRDVFVPWLFIGVFVAGTAVMALHEGNFGTLVRHRDGLVPFVLCLSAIAIASMMQSVRATALDLAESSTLIKGVRRLIRSVPLSRAAYLRAMWRASALCSAIDELRMMERWQWFRRLGSALLVGAALAVALAPFGDQALPSLFAWGVMVICALVLIAYPRALAIAFSERNATPGEGGSQIKLGV